MCLINNSYQFIFVHVPKSAGTSLTATFTGFTNYCDLEIGGTAFGERIQPAYRDRFGLAKHSTAAEIKSLVGAVTWNRYFTFAFVRNPFRRALSTYHFLRKWEGAESGFHEQMRSFESFEEFVLSDFWNTTQGPDQIFRPQMYWLRSPGGGNQVLPRFIGKVEQMEQDIETVLDLIGAPQHLRAKAEVKRLNSSGPADLGVFENEEVVSRILERYKVDFELLNYSMSPAEI